MMVSRTAELDRRLGLSSHEVACTQIRQEDAILGDAPELHENRPA
jgi:hypothetical protein